LWLAVTPQVPGAFDNGEHVAGFRARADFAKPWHDHHDQFALSRKARTRVRCRTQAPSAHLKLTHMLKFLVLSDLHLVDKTRHPMVRTRI